MERKNGLAYAGVMAKDASRPQRAEGDGQPAEGRRFDALAPDAESIGTSSIAQAAQRAVDHFSARDASGTGDAPGDSIEIWGRRIGRTLSLAAFIGLCIYLYATYLR